HTQRQRRPGPGPWPGVQPRRPPGRLGGPGRTHPTNAFPPGGRQVSSTPIRTTSRRALAVLTAVVALAAGCSGDDTSGSASTTKARDGSTSSTTADGDGTARAPLDATPVRLVSLDLDANDPIDLAYRSDSTSLLVAERGGT